MVLPLMTTQCHVHTTEPNEIKLIWRNMDSVDPRLRMNVSTHETDTEPKEITLLWINGPCYDDFLAVGMAPVTSLGLVRPVQVRHHLARTEVGRHQGVPTAQACPGRPV